MREQAVRVAALRETATVRVRMPRGAQAAGSCRVKMMMTCVCWLQELPAAMPHPLLYATGCSFNSSCCSSSTCMHQPTNTHSVNSMRVLHKAYN